jgi:hypothetical protein
MRWVDKMWPTGNGRHFTYGSGFHLGYGHHPHGIGNIDGGSAGSCRYGGGGSVEHLVTLGI